MPTEQLLLEAGHDADLAAAFGDDQPDEVGEIKPGDPDHFVMGRDQRDVKAEAASDQGSANYPLHHLNVRDESQTETVDVKVA